MSKLSIIVATYRMQREAPRTIRSLLPPLQRCVDDVDYEIVVVDNGSPEFLDSVAWQTDLDALYSISVWAGAHDRNNRLLQNESNAFAMTRATWDSLGGYDERFARPGGGLR